MRRVSTAEWILSFVMPADHAAATAGDLLELSPRQGSGWYWRSVLGIFAASIVRSMVQRPGPVLGVAAGGFLMQFLAPLPFLYVFLALINHPTALTVSVLCVLTLTQYVIGRSIAVLSRGNPAAVCVAIGLLNCIAGALNLHNASINMAIWQIPVIVGVIMAQRKLKLVRHA